LSFFFASAALYSRTFRPRASVADQESLDTCWPEMVIEEMAITAAGTMYLQKDFMIIGLIIYVTQKSNVHLPEMAIW
jgi:hypothetical protein